MYKTKFNRFVNWIIVLLMLSGCSGRFITSNQEEVIDRGLMIDDICAPPCWHGMEINKSAKEEVIFLLSKQSFIKPQSLKEHETYWTDSTTATTIQYECITSRSSPCGILTFHNGLLVKNWAAVNYDLTLDSVIQHLGEPDYLMYFWPNPSGICEISVIWIEKGISVSFNDRGKHNECKKTIDGNKLSPDILIESVLYISQGELEDSINTLDGCCAIIKWAGFEND